MRRRTALKCVGVVSLGFVGCISGSREGGRKPELSENLTLEQKLDRGGWVLRSRENDSYIRKTPIGEVRGVSNTTLYRKSDESRDSRFFFDTTLEVEGVPFGFSRVVSSAGKEIKSKFQDRMRNEGLTGIRKRNIVQREIDGDEREITVYSGVTEDSKRTEYRGLVAVWGNASARKIYVTGGLYPNETVDGTQPSIYKKELYGLMSSFERES